MGFADVVSYFFAIAALAGFGYFIYKKVIEKRLKRRGGSLDNDGRNKHIN